MPAKKKIVFCFLLLATAAGLGAIVYWHVAFPRFGPAEVASIEPGMSRAEVTAILGPPHIKLGKNEWRYTDRPGWSMLLDIEFDEGGRVIRKDYHD